MKLLNTSHCSPPPSSLSPPQPALFAEVRTLPIFQKISSKSLSFNMTDLGLNVSDNIRCDVINSYLLTLRIWGPLKKAYIQLRASSYKVKLSECYLVRGHVSTRIPTYRHEVIDSDDTDDIGPLTIAAPPVSTLEITTELLVAPPNITPIPIAPPEITAPPEVPLMIAAPPEVEITAPAETSAHDSARPIGRRQKPPYLQDYII